MTIYIKDFRFTRVLGKQEISFSFFNIYGWKKASIPDPFVDKAENVASYTKLILQYVQDFICNGEQDPIKRDIILKKFEAKQFCMVQLNVAEFTDAKKIFS